jgi:hypothetical protein
MLSLANYLGHCELVARAAKKSIRRCIMVATHVEAESGGGRRRECQRHWARVRTVVSLAA